ncbi:hypothetical protein C7H19_00120 [Aphanothece hegewaldii CCALA 016]|uniref:Uncharacterized protein n=1 Tax=Aphanothece hegewaldii CCALA 016 TaxID=2107694 RepID=A0A2T1M328_9CHRO|nr:hormogonium polysaccharide biosynthesis protein HpsA [Aphanothece hegewaldii]PSF39232.1 hypothetical protein C7H19_00120 [Aphanothece hegewaldii CCALA 016]
MSKSRATNIPRWIKRTGSKINTLCRTLLNFRQLNFQGRSKTHPVRLKTRRPKDILTGISRNLFSSSKYGKRRRLWSKGFILPTITMILMVFSLVVSSILVRTAQNTQGTIGSRQSQVSYNLATPAVERAKSKIEFLFKRDSRFPNAIPTEEYLERLMWNRQNDPDVAYYTNDANVYEDIYTLPQETRIDIDKDNKPDNAWVYDTDIDGDGVNETVVYSILMRNRRDTTNLNSPLNTKASKQVTRNGPLTLLNGMSIANCSIPGAQGEKVEGWYAINTATVRKNFQVNAVVVKKVEAGKTSDLRNVSSIEFQQDRQMDMGNKWGVWFRYDLEAYPGPDFNWNGAMHTDGNIIWGDTSGGTGISTFLISSPNSCLYTEDASEITVAQNETKQGQITFQGQIMTGNPTPDNFEGKSEIDLYPGAGVAPSGSYKAVGLNKSTDSVKDSLQTGSPYQFSLDPITVFTEDRSVSRYTADPTNASVRSSSWTGSSTYLDHRMRNKLIRRPYLDDLYRADDRWGPKPTYNNKIKVPSAAAYGQDISGTFSDELTKEEPPSAFPDEVGLDGYWERRARVEGLRLIVGQRLELGNTFGWFGNNDPLYLPNSTTLTNLDRQRRSLRDNLAAVQSTLVYHYQNDKDFPVATIATTVHPGTTKTRDQSLSFRNLPYKFQNTNFDAAEIDHVNTDFLTGVGTNGWEFNPPGNAADQAAFATMIESSTNPLRIALNNLALFAGDSQGAFPPVKETSGSIIHPNPDYTMWGNFSELRRVLLNANGSPKTITYSDLSIADRTTVQTAASTLGLLAYNLDNLKKQYEGITKDSVLYKIDSSNSKIIMKALAIFFQQLVDGDTTNGEVNNLISPKVPFPKNYDASKDAATFYGQFTPDQYIEAFQKMPSFIALKTLQQEDADKLLARSRLLATYIQVERDRTLGFQKGYMASPTLLAAKTNKTSWETTFTNSTDDGNGKSIVNPKLVVNSTNINGVVLSDPPLNIISSVGNGLNTAAITGTTPNQQETFNTVCDPEIFNTKPDGTKLSLSDIDLAGLSVAFCSKAITPKYPSLYFIFPRYNHNYLGFLGNDTTENAFGIGDNQPKTGATGANGVPEEYIDDAYLALDRPLTRTFNILSDTKNNTTDAAGADNIDDLDSLAKIALQPKALDGTLSNWKLPRNISTTDPSPTGTSSDRVNKIEFYPNNVKTFARIPFLDTAFYDGRQLMQVRALNVDLKMLNNNSIGTDTWLTKSGIIYAFREDAVREDGIARPAGATFDNCNTETEVFSSSCRMKVNTTISQDPPNNSTTGVSIKPVDYYADPARRLHSFRLINGSDVSRTGTKMGVSFISDNPVYIQGNLNLHQTSGGARLEEFTQKLTSNWDNFYSRDTLDTKFAKEANDRWRPVEILGDALTVLSNSFCDGTVEDGFRNDNGSCPSGTSSYRNSTLAKNGLTTWQRENLKAAADSLDAPIRIDRNAQIVKSDGTVFTDYRTLGDDKTLNTVDPNEDIRTNAIFISGLVPSRAKQSYGGLHNFPRYIENWSGEPLNILGAFIQLNFSTYATGPWDQEAWEPGQNPTTGETIRFYSPPNRRWGYDVALQYNPPGPVAARFISVGSPRNEFYQQLAADDPYTKQLRCATVNGVKIDTKATDCN